MLCGTPSREFAAAFPAGELIVGVDEAGRGPLAGPVVAAAVVLCKPRPAGLDDSKKLTGERRALLEERIRRRCAFGIGVVDVEHIDTINIFQATMWAMAQAVARLCEVIGCDPHQVLVDGNLTPAGRRAEWRWPARAIVGGDACEPCISAASILAKEYRDRIMREHAQAHPEYGWHTNVGYSTPEHLRALRLHGPTPLHRRSFAPVAQTEMVFADIESSGPHHQMSSPAHA
jgi:ribonuclease HII